VSQDPGQQQVRRVEQLGELIIHSVDDGFDPELVSQILGLTPARSYRRGERSRGGRIRDWSAWCWQTPQLVEVDSEVLVALVLDRFEAVSERLRDVRSRWDVTVQVGLVVHCYGTMQSEGDKGVWADVPSPSLSFESGTVGRLAALDVSLDIDQYVSVPD